MWNTSYLAIRLLYDQTDWLIKSPEQAKRGSRQIIAHASIIISDKQIVRLPKSKATSG